MRRCSSECHPLCDFCEHYAFNGQPVKGLSGQIAMVYVGEGRCEHPDHPHDQDPCGGCDDFYCGIQAKEDKRHADRIADFEALTRSLLWWCDVEDDVDCTVPEEMRTDNAYSGAVFADETPKNLRDDAHGSLRHSRAHTRAQRERYITKRLGYYPWHTAPAGLLAKWNGGSNVRQRRAERSWAGKNDRNLKRPKYPLDPEAA